MASMLDSVDQRTRMAGQNRLELLLFHLKGRQLFGINVFKIKEVIQCPKLTQIPSSNSIVRGVATMRGQTIPILDLGYAIGRSRIADEEVKNSLVIVSEFNRKVQGFMVGAVSRIINLNWEDILPPPPGSGKDNYLTAVTRVDGELVEIIDVEKVLSEVVGQTVLVSGNIIAEGQLKEGRVYRALIADDSSVARSQIRKTMEQIGLECTIVHDGKEAYDLLMEMAKSGPIEDQIDVVISDIEMPEMDGYMLTSEIRKAPELKNLFVALHTSLSGGFNDTITESVGADLFISKFSADDLAEQVLAHLATLD